MPGNRAPFHTSEIVLRHYCTIEKKEWERPAGTEGAASLLGASLAADNSENRITLTNDKSNTW